MVSINPTTPIVTPTTNNGVTPKQRVMASSGADNRQFRASDRRFKMDRRGRRASQQVVDRRTGSERRRSTIDLSV